VAEEGSSGCEGRYLRLEELDAAAASGLGEEARDLAELAAAALPVAGGLIARVDAESPSRLAPLVERALAGAACVRLRPLLPTRSQARRFERQAGIPVDIIRSREIEASLAELASSLASSQAGPAGGAPTALFLRIVGCDSLPAGRAASTNPDDGNPDEVVVYSRVAPVSPYRIDRRTTRVLAPGEGLSAEEAAAAADLADRVQLVLGRPVVVEWCTQGGRLGIVGVRSLVVTPAFGYGSWRRLALMAADEGTVAPLAIDTLNDALAPVGTAGGEAWVRRVYARPYRRRDGLRARSRYPADPLSIARATARVASVTTDVVAPLAAARAFQRTFDGRLAKLDAEPLESLSEAALRVALEERQALACEVFDLVDRAREASLTALMALEAVGGPLPRDAFAALAAPRPVRARRELEARLQHFAAEVDSAAGTIAGRNELSFVQQRRWDELRGEVTNLRPLGIDVRPDAYGASDEAFRDALEAHREVELGASERRRRQAAKTAAAEARRRPFGRGREGLVQSLLLLLGRVAKAKGSLAEALASALLRFRRGALVAGQRLAHQGLIESHQDALYLHGPELQEALAGEPGAYAARARARREDDARWERFDAPRRIEGQRADHLGP
jgi:hypothetical protein